MTKQFAVENVKCEGCATSIKHKLKPKFGEVEVDLSKMPRVISLDISADREEELRHELRMLGYPLSSDELGVMENAGAKVKSFVSCAIGKMENRKKAPPA